MDENHLTQHTSPAAQYEDAALKISMQFFAEELLPYLGISGKVSSYAPTELIHLEIQKFFQDFDLFMEDGSIKHFEFQSTNPGLAGLKRFRIYEALASSRYKMPVTTYVLYSGNIRNPMTEFTEGINTYRVIPIIMQDINADDFFAGLLTKIQDQSTLEKKDLVPLTLTPLMGGQMPLKDRIKTSYAITGNLTTDTISTDELQKIEAVVYTMAEKFLDSIDLQEIKEGILMSGFLTQLVHEEAEKVATQKAVKMAEQMAKQMAEQRANEIAKQMAKEIAEKKAEEIAEKKAEEMAEKKAEEMAEKKAEEMVEKRAEKERTNALLEAARRLLPLLDVQVIAETVGLPLETIHQLKEEVQEKAMSGAR